MILAGITAVGLLAGCGANVDTQDGGALDRAQTEDPGSSADD